MYILHINVIYLHICIFYIAYTIMYILSYISGTLIQRGGGYLLCTYNPWDIWWSPEHNKNTET